MTIQIFIDGEAGTTGLQIRELLLERADVRLLGLDPARRKDLGAKRELFAQADIVILCLPDEAAREASAAIEALGSRRPRLLDASTAHRTARGWVYGFPELAPGQAEAVRDAERVANPGCYATGAIAVLRPLVDAGLIPSDLPVAINAVSGYSGGGRTMIAAFESGNAPAFELYALELEHKHVPEIEMYSGLRRRPLFVPSVGNFRQGMLVSVPLFLDDLPGAPKLGDLRGALRARYAAGSPFVAMRETDGTGRIEPEALNGTNRLELGVFGSEERRQALLVARLDNLGKGAARAALQNLDLMASRR